MADRLTGMEVFVQAIRRGGLSAAARAMGMSPTMAARHLTELEVRLGTTLVHRSTRRLALTDAGLAYLDRADRVLAEIAEADADAAARSVAIEGRLRISAPATFGTMHVVPLAAAFRRLHPGVTIELGLEDRYVDLLREGWDAAIRIGRLRDSGLIARRLAPVRLSICASPAYLAARGTPRSLDDLAGHDCLGFTLATLTGPAIWGFGADGGRRVPVSTGFSANNGEALVRAAIADAGLVYGPRFIAADAVASGALVEVPPIAEYMDLGAVQLVSHPDRHPTARLRAWIDHLATHIPPIAHGW